MAKVEYVNQVTMIGDVHKIFQQTKKFAKFCLKIKMYTPKGNEYSVYATVKSFDGAFAEKLNVGDKVNVVGSLSTEIFNDKMYTYVAADDAKVV